jgi:outer membrane lipoprotein-sorting protein
LKKLIFGLLITINTITLFFTGCVPSMPLDEVEILPSERLINKLEINRRRIKSFEGNGIISVRSESINNNIAFRVVLQKPDSLYLTMYGPFNVELAQALVTKNDFIFYDALRNTAYRGDIDNDVIRQIFKIDLTFGDLMDAFIGSVNLTDHLYKQPNKYEIEYDKYILTYIDSVTNNKSVYRVDVRELGITNYEVTDGNGNNLLEGKYSKFEILETVAVPYKIELQNKHKNQRVSIDYRNIAANKRNIVIDFKLPNDATVIQW